jgi:hypothetical protein
MERRERDSIRKMKRNGSGRELCLNWILKRKAPARSLSGIPPKSDPLEFCDAAAGDPFDDVDIADRIGGC